mgnify:CR=1 FL=1
MKKINSAKCPCCEDRLGRATEVKTEDGKDYTVYQCTSCEEKWLRPHN